MYTVKICAKEYKRNWTLKEEISIIKFYMFWISVVEEDRIF
jgi:hypothetical protein